MNTLMEMNYRQKKFHKAATSYHMASGLQKQMAQSLVEYLPSEFYPKFVLELGCGTGHLTSALIKKFPESQFEISDISTAMIGECQNHLPVFGLKGSINWRVLDAEGPFPPMQADLVCSNALLQWVENLDAHFSNCHKVLNSNGYLLMSAFSPGNFPELQNVLKITNLPVSLNNPGTTSKQIQEALDANGFRMLAFREKNFPKYYRSPMDFLKSLKNIGANGNFGPVLTPSQLNSILDCYQKHYSFGEGVMASWKPWFCLAQKLD